jgi:hypothetical protein
MNIKKNIGLITAIILFCLCYNSLSQSSFSYTYDAAGNQNQRTYIVNMIANKVIKSVNNAQLDTSNVVALAEKLKVTIFPNPTKGELKLDISGLEDNTSVDLTLYNPRGQLLLRQKATQGLTIIDMFSYPAGWYLLKVSNGSNLLSFKIVKD